MSSTACPLAPEARARLEGLPDAVALYDRDWVIAYVNPAYARLAERPAEELIGRNIWVALPELAGTVFHAFLLRARRAEAPVTWTGFYPPSGRWLEITAAAMGGLLQVSVRPFENGPQPLPAGAGEADGGVGGGEAADRLRFLAEVSETMIATLDTGEAAARLAELATRRLCDWAAVTLVGDDAVPGEDVWAHRDPARRADLDTYQTGRVRGTSARASVTAALLSGEPVQVAPIDPALVAPSLATDRVRAAWRRLDTTSATVVPLRARGETFGVLALMNCGDRPAHTELEIATAVEVARRGALALDNARLYARQLTVAATLQHSLLSPPLQLPGLQITVRYRPAGRHQQVGGDWYDTVEQSDGAALLVIGDVVGHSVQASAAMGQIRSILRGIAYDRGETPAAVLTRVDRVLAGLRVDTLATALVARLEPAPGPTGPRRLLWCSAGHLPPLLLYADGTARVLASRPERLLGTAAPVRRSDHEAVLAPGDTLLLYTDGLVEHGHREFDAGIAELATALPELDGVPLEQFCDRLLDRLAAGRTDDDIALLAVRDARPAPRPGRAVVGRQPRTSG